MPLELPQNFLFSSLGLKKPGFVSWLGQGNRDNFRTGSLSGCSGWQQLNRTAE